MGSRSQTEAHGPWWGTVLACPMCHGELQQVSDTVQCTACKLVYPMADAVPSFLCREMYATDADFDFARRIIEYWGHGWQQRLADPEHAPLFTMTRERLLAYAANDRIVHRTHKSSLGTDLDLDHVRGLTALNIGCGAGTEALLLAASGARTVGLDITAPAANAADHLIRHIGALGGGVQADARFLPVAPTSIDVVYSSGVLHHSPDIAKSVAEVHRVLKPGGTAYVMLYATWSLLFYQERLAGMFRGRVSATAQEAHMSASTEGAWRSATRTNPLTRTFTVAECKSLFGAFSSVTVRKSTASVRQIRILGRVLASLGLVAWLDRRLDGMDRWWGACLYIRATK